MDAAAVLGVAGDMVGAEEPRSHYVTKVGGAPWVPSGGGHGDGADADAVARDAAHWLEATACGACGRPLSLVLQAYAPLQDSAGPPGPPVAACPERVLLIMGCAHPGCGRAPGSWRAFRWQMPPAAVAGGSAGGVAAAAAASAGPSAAPAPQQGGASAGGRPGADGRLGAAGAPGAGAAPASAALEDDPFAGGFAPVGDDPFAGGFDAFDEQPGPPGGGGVASGGASGGGRGGGALDFSDLGAALDACAVRTQEVHQHHQQQQHASSRKGAADEAHTHGGGGGGAGGSALACGSRELPVRGPPLPEFYVAAVEEPAGRRDLGDAVDAVHVQRLLEEYERHEAAAAGSGPGRAVTAAATSAAAAAPSTLAHAAVTGGRGMAARAAAAAAAVGGAGRARQRGASAGPAGGDAGDSDGEDGADGGNAEGAESSAASESWAGEEYEEDHVRGVAGPYLKFAARLARRPDQCARYGRGAALLWPLRTAPQPPPCPHCGGPRVPELQLLAPLIALLLDCASWLDAQGLQRHAAAINAAANWDLAALAVYTCAVNCCGSGSSDAGGTGGAGGCREGRAGQGGPSMAVCSEEWVALANEEQCHVAEELALER